MDLHGQIERQVLHVLSPAHHQQHQTLPGQGHVRQGRAVLGDIQGGLL